MNKRLMSAVCILAIFCVCAVLVSRAHAKPQTILSGVMDSFKNTGTILEIRRTKDNKAYDMTILVKDKVVAYYIPDKGSAQVRTTARKYDLEKIKSLTSGAQRAMWLVVNFDDLKKVRPTIRAITLRENEKGDLEFCIHNYHPVDASYRKTYLVDTKKWAVLPDSITMDDPIEQSDEEWYAPTPETPPAEKAPQPSGQGAAQSKPEAGEKTGGAEKAAE